MAALEGHLKYVRSFSNFAARFSQHLGNTPVRKIHISASNSSVTGKEPEVKNPLPLFLSKDVQSILHRITRPQPTQVFGEHIISEDVVPKYKILTDEELQKEREEFEEKGKMRLQMPPYMNMRRSCKKNLEKNPTIKGALTSNYTFTDISTGRQNKDRIIVVRNMNGTLNTADWETRERMLQIFYPRPGKAAMMPKMFTDEYLKDMLTDKKYVYVLERACVQFEPDDQHFIRVTRRIYEHVFKHREFDLLRSTRFFGPMSFYFCEHKKIEPLLIDMINKNLVQDAADLVMLYHLIQGNEMLKEENIVKDIQTFCQTEATQEYQNDLLNAIRNFVVNYKVFKRVHEGR